LITYSKMQRNSDRWLQKLVDCHMIDLLVFVANLLQWLKGRRGIPLY